MEAIRNAVPIMMKVEVSPKVDVPLLATQGVDASQNCCRSNLHESTETRAAT